MLVQQLVFEALFPDLVELDFALRLTLDPSLFLVFIASSSLSFLLVCAEKCLVFTLLLINALHGLFIFLRMFLRRTGSEFTKIEIYLPGRVEICQSELSLGNIFSQNIVNVAVLHLLLRLQLLFPPVLQYQLQLLLLIKGKLVRILEQLHKLAFGQAAATLQKLLHALGVLLLVSVLLNSVLVRALRRESAIFAHLVRLHSCEV